MPQFAVDASLLGRSDSLADGAAGVALLHIERAFRFGRSDDAREWIVAMTRAEVTAHPDQASLYRGAPAVAFTLHASGRAGYARTLTVLDQHVEWLTRQRLTAAHRRIDQGLLPELREWDLVTGLTGIGAQQLHRGGDALLLREILTYLVRLTKPVRVGNDVLPGWWCPSPPANEPASRWPGGHGNLGMAHGIAGPLALLSSASLRGTIVDGQVDAMKTIDAWFDQWRHDDPAATWWPGMISLGEWRDGIAQGHGPQRPSWCYGVPGIARALQLAAVATQDYGKRRAAESALVSCVRDTRQLRQIRDASLCHGWAGLVQAVRCAGRDAEPSGDFPAAIAEADLHFADHLRMANWPAQPGLLEGSAGVELVLTGDGSDASPLTAWDTCLLLSG